MAFLKIANCFQGILFTLLALAALAPAGLSATLSSVERTAVAVGEKFTFTGSGFTGASAASFFWNRSMNAAVFNVLSDTKLEVTVPNVIQKIRDHFQLIESGAVLQSVPGNALNCVILAEDGATLDLRGTTISTSSPPRVIYSSGATLLGNLPAPTGGIGGPVSPRQVTSHSLSRDIAPFKEGFELILNPQGPGSVTVDPVMEFYPRGTASALTAIPNAGNHFIRWGGGISRTTNPMTFAIGNSFPITARFSDRPDFFTGWRAQHFTASELADPTVSGLDADPDGDQIRSRSGWPVARLIPGGRP